MITTTATPAQRLAELAATVSAEGLSAELRDDMARRVVDFLGNSLAALREKPAAVVTAVANSWGGQPTAETVASDHGAGNLGFAGTARREAAAAATGLATLSDDEFGGGPKMPMVPGTWDPDGPPEDSDGPDNS